MVKYNLDQLVRVAINDFYKSDFYEWRPKKTFLGFIIQEEGIYDIFDDYKGVSYDDTKYIIKDGVFYEKPEVILHFADRSCTKKIFNTYDEAKEYASQYTVGENWHKL